MSVFYAYLVFAMFAVLWFDITRFIIPNWLVASLIALFPLAVWTSPHAIDWRMALAGTAIVFVAGYGIFAMKWMGAGDIKLLVACSLWTGWQNLLEFVFMVALLGGLFSVIVWVARKILPSVPPRWVPKTTPRILRDREPIPYGVAISAGFLIMISGGKIPLLIS